MAGRIEIDDLVLPRLSDAQKQMIAATEANPIFLDEKAVLDAARQATGLSPCTGSIAMLSGSGLSLWLASITPASVMLFTGW